MAKQKKINKISKLLKNPNMFFYDYFRKRAFKGTQPLVTKMKTSPQISIAPPIDLLEVQHIGIVEYIRKNLSAGIGPEDGIDKNSLLIWSGYIKGLVGFIGGLKEVMPMNVTIYTLGGGYNYTSKENETFDIKKISESLTSRPDFVIELFNPFGEIQVLHIFLYDLMPTGVANTRSNKAWIRKFSPDDINNLFDPTNYAPDNKTKIDAVYTWVNHADITWQKYWQDTFPEEPFDPDRYTSNDELKYSLRSLNKYAPWLNNIYIVSNCSKPEWLNSHDKIIWVSHEEIFPNMEQLPTFNSHAIESCIHKIENLSENFIYFNDDFILSQPCIPSDFFDEIGRSIAYFEPYGMVSLLDKNDELPDYIIASKNSNILLKKVLKNYEARNLHRHVPYALKKSVLLEMESKFNNEFNDTRNAKRRSVNDINITSFLYHHYSYISGLAVKGDISSLIVRPENVKDISSKDAYKYKILCFNDGNGSAEDANYKKYTQHFFEKRLSEKAVWEKKSISKH